MYMFHLVPLFAPVRENKEALIKVERESILEKSRAPEGCGSAGLMPNEYV
jgi:hypothetical protein